MAWKLQPTEDYERGFKWYEKKRQRELKAVLTNLTTYFRSLEAGNRPRDINHRFIHPEQNGVVAIDQKGGPANLEETRLYVFAHVETETLHLILIDEKGNRRHQQENVTKCGKYATRIIERTQEAHECSHRNSQDAARGEPGEPGNSIDRTDLQHSRGHDSESIRGRTVQEGHPKTSQQAHDH